jgi:hypothetical protein
MNRSRNPAISVWGCYAMTTETLQISVQNYIHRQVCKRVINVVLIAMSSAVMNLDEVAIDHRPLCDFSQSSRVLRAYDTPTIPVLDELERKTIMMSGSQFQITSP